MGDLVLQRSISDCAGFLRTSAKGDLFACLAGVAALPLMLFVCLPLERQVPPALSAILMLMLLSFGSAHLAASRANTSVVPVRSILPSGARLGARMGAIIFLAGGGMVLLASVIRELFQGVPPGDYSWVVPTVSSTSGILLTVFPTVAIGALGAVIGISRSGAFQDPGGREDAAPSPRRRACVGMPPG